MKMLAMSKSKVRRRMMSSGTMGNLDILGQIVWTLEIQEELQLVVKRPEIQEALAPLRTHT